MSESNRHIALVTGGSRGIGKAIALAFANSGVGVAIDYRERAEEAASVVDVIHRIGGPAVAIAVNLKSVFLCTQAVLPHMRARRWGRNINISSIGARIGARSSSVAWRRGWSRLVPCYSSSETSTSHPAVKDGTGDSHPIALADIY